MILVILVTLVILLDSKSGDPGEYGGSDEAPNFGRSCKSSDSDEYGVSGE